MRRRHLERYENKLAFRNLIAVGTVLAALALSGCGLSTVGYPIPGPAGKDGVNGKDGAPGTQITVVQLCPNNNQTTYPSIFSEVAFCIQGKLYAVYSQNGGFDSEIPPGTYSSNGINSSCTFKVLSNCVVEQQ